MTEKPEAIMWANPSENDPSTLEQRIEEVKAAISGAPERIEKELSRTPNSWIECYTSAVAAVSGFFEVLLMKFPDAEDTLEFANKNMKNLLVKLNETRAQYGKRVPEGLKEELMSQLDIFKER